MEQQGAGPLWARFYALDTEKPIIGDRYKSLHDDMNEISLERRNGHARFNTVPAAALSNTRLGREIGMSGNDETWWKSDLSREIQPKID
jgi:hypothetical protein